MVTNELQKVMDAYNKISHERKEWQILLEARQIEVDLVAQESEKVKVHLNNIRKSPSHNSAKSNRTTSRGEDIIIKVPTDLYIIPFIILLKVLLISLVILVVTLVTNLLTVENFPLENRFGDQKLLILTLKDPKILGYQKN